MKHVYGLLIAIVLVPAFVNAQDEGNITKKERIGRSSNIFVSAGPSFNFGKNIGDYGTGINIEVGYAKRVNRLLSIGPSISYITFKYKPEDASIENGNAYYGTGLIDTDWYGSYFSNWDEKYNLTGNGISSSYDYGYELTLNGGDISLLSLACNVKLNLVPVKDTSPISVYLFVKPFITRSTRKAVTGQGVFYVFEAYEDFNGGAQGTPPANADNEFDDILHYATDDDTWYATGYTEDWGPEGFPVLEEKSVITGGVFLGPGLEFMPAKSISVFLQPAIGYTFPLTFVSTKSYSNTSSDYVSEEFPIVKKGFTSLNVQLGISYNF
jgi:hypothetical protein